MTSTTDARPLPARRLRPIYKSPADHLVGVITWLVKVLKTKYRKGQAEHGGELYAKPGALTNLEDEILDLIVYHQTAKKQLKMLAEDGATAAEAFEFLYGETVD